MVLFEILMIAILLAISVLVHELGHWIWYWRNKQQPFNISFFYYTFNGFGFKSIWKVKVTQEEEMNSLLMGIGAGILVIVFVMLSTAATYFVYALPIYMAGCRHDLHRLIEIIKEKNIDFKIDLKQEK